MIVIAVFFRKSTLKTEEKLPEGGRSQATWEIVVVVIVVFLYLYSLEC